MNTVNKMVSKNKYRIYESKDNTYFFLLDKNGAAVYAQDKTVLDKQEQYLSEFEQQAYRYPLAKNENIKEYPSLKSPDTLYKEVRKDKQFVLIADEKGRYEDRMGERGRNAFRDRPFYFCFKEKDENQIFSLPLYHEYIVVMANEGYTACDYFNLCYPSDVPHAYCCSEIVDCVAWENGKKEQYADKEPYDIITKEDIIKEFGTDLIKDTEEYGEQKARFGYRFAKPREPLPVDRKNGEYEEFRGMSQRVYEAQQALNKKNEEIIQE